MLTALTVLLVCQLAGEVAARFLGLPVPGPVLGMALSLPCWAASASPIASASPAHALMRYLSLLFVPAGVGLIRQAHQPIAIRAAK